MLQSVVVKGRSTHELTIFFTLCRFCLSACTYRSAPLTKNCANANGAKVKAAPSSSGIFVSTGKTWKRCVLATAFLIQTSHRELTSHWPSARWVDAMSRTSAIQNNLPFTRTLLFFRGTALLFVLICVLYSLPCSRSPYTHSTSWINGKLSEKSHYRPPLCNSKVKRRRNVALSSIFSNETLKPKTYRTQWSLMKLFNASVT